MRNWKHNSIYHRFVFLKEKNGEEFFKRKNGERLKIGLQR